MHTQKIHLTAALPTWENKNIIWLRAGESFAGKKLNIIGSSSFAKNKQKIC